MKPGKLALSICIATAFAMSSATLAQEKVVLKSAKSTSSYYVMMVQLSEMLKKAGGFSPTVEESQGSVQNVKESKVRPGNFLFTTPPSLLAAAAAGTGPFEGDAFDNARTLFVMPFVTIHFIAREDSGIATMSELAGKTIIGGGIGTFCEQRTKKILEVLDLLDNVTLAPVEHNAVNAAIRNKKVDGYTDCSSHPSPSNMELSSNTNLNFISMSDEERAKIIELDPLSGPITISAGTYNGQDKDVYTVGVPVGAYGTTNMSDEAAYAITRTFWEQKDVLAGEQPWWKAVTPELVKLMGAQVHPGAGKYYRQMQVEVPASQ